MKRVFTKIFSPLLLTFVGWALGLTAQAQTLSQGLAASGSNDHVSALTSDKFGNVWAVVNPGNGSTSSLVEYVGGKGSPQTIATGIADNDPSDGSYTDCLASDTHGNIYLATNAGATSGAVYQFVYPSYTTKNTLITGSASIGYFEAIALGPDDNLYVVQYNVNGNTANQGLGDFEIARYPSTSTSTVGGTVLYTDLDHDFFAGGTADSYTHIVGLQVDASSNIYVADGWDINQTPTSANGEHIYKLLKPGSGNTYTRQSTPVATGLHAIALAMDATRTNLYATLVTGSDYTTYSLVEYTGGTGSPTTLYTGFSTGGSLYFPFGIAYVTDQEIFVSNGKILASGNVGDLDELYGAPATQASGITFSSTGLTTTTVNWTNGNGASRAVFMAAASSGTPAPAFGTTYTANTAFGTVASEIGSSGWFCIYNGSGSATPVNVTGLSAATTYRVMVVEYDGTSTFTDYVTTAGTNNPNNVTTITPTISAPGGTVTVAATVQGTPGASTSFNISGSNLLANVTATAPSNVQVSSDNSSWGSTATITQSGGTITNSPVYVRLAGSGSVGTISGNVALSSTSATTINQAVSGSLNSPSTTISSLTAVTSTTTNAASVQYTATFAASITGLSTSDFTLSTSGVSGASVTSVSGSGTSWTVTVNTGSGDGTIQLQMNSASGLNPSVSNIPFNGSTYTIDKTAPTVAIGSPSLSATNTGPVTYTVTYADSHFNTSSLGTGNITLITTGNANGTVGVTGSGTSYTVTISSITGTGSLGFTIGSGTATDQAGNSAPASSASTTFAVDNTAPTVSSITATSALVTKGTTTYTVTFSKAVTGVDASDFTATKTGTVTSGTIAVTPSSSTVYTVSIASVAGDGSLRLDLNGSGTGITDALGNAISGGFTGGSTYTIDNTSPTLSISSPSVALGNSSTFFDYTVTYNDANLGTLPSQPIGALAVFNNLTYTGSTSLGSLQVFNSVGNTVRIEFHGITGDGTIGFTIPAGTANDLAGNAALASPASATFAVDNTPPTVSIGAPSLSVTKNGPVTYTVTYADANFGTSTLSTSDITLNATGNANATVGVTGSGTSYTVTLSSITGAGTLGFTIGANTATDLAGNSANASSPSATFIVGNNDATLSNLAISNGTLSPSFATGTLAYTDNVGYSQNVIKLTPTLNDPNATVTVGGNATASGAQSMALRLRVGDNVIPVVVTAQDGVNTQEYDVTVTRAQSTNDTLTTLKISPYAALTAVVGPGINFKANEPYYVTSITVTPTFGNGDQMVTINGGQVSSGAASPPIPLNVGANVITTVITAQNGGTRTMYLTVTRAASSNAGLSFMHLSNGAALSPAFNHATTSYTATVLYAVSSITVTPTLANANGTITVNGSPTASGSASAPVSLNVGDNNITVVATAQDGVTQQTYTVVVTRQMSHIASLSFIRLSNGTTGNNIAYSPAFNYMTTEYNASVTSAVTSVTILARLSDPNAILTINGNAATSGVASAPIALSPGPNMINLAVLAADGTTTGNYAVIVTAPGSAPPITQPVASIAVATTNGLNTSGDNLVVRPGVSPNGDGVNDYLTIDGINNYPDNKLLIMNRNGALVYEAKGYDNTSKIFDGHSNKDGKMQTPGTYFYSLEYTEKGVTKHKTGYIILKY